MKNFEITQTKIDRLNALLKQIQAEKKAAEHAADAAGVSEYDDPTCVAIYEAEEIIGNEIKRLVLLQAEQLNNANPLNH
jgi:hypothetical protein